MDPAIRKMSRELTKMNQALTPHLNLAIDASREVTFHMDKTAEAFNKLGSASAAIHKTYKSVADKFDFELLTQIETIYAEISKTFSSYSKIIQEERENFSANVENFFTFCSCEVEGLEEVASDDQLLNLRNEFSLEYKEKRQLLDAKKEAIYPTMDLKKWEIDQDTLPIPKTQLIGDKATALKYMFPKVEIFYPGNAGREESTGFLGFLQFADQQRAEGVRPHEHQAHERPGRRLYRRL